MSTAYEHEIAPRVGLEHYTRVATPTIRFVAWLAPELGKGPRAEFSVWVPTTQTFEYFVVHATIKDSATKKDRTDLLHSINSARYSSLRQNTRSPAYTTSQVSPAATEYWLRHQEKEARARSMLTPVVRLNIERAWALQRALAGQPQSQPLPPQGQGRQPLNQGPPQPPQGHLPLPSPPMLPLSLQSSQTPVDRPAPHQILTSMGIPAEDARVLLSMEEYRDMPYHAALAYAKQDPSGAFIMLLGTQRPTGITSRYEADPADRNNTRFSLLDLLSGLLSEQKTLHRLHELVNIHPPLIIKLLRGCDDDGRLVIHNVMSCDSAPSSGRVEAGPGLKVLRAIARCAEAEPRVLALTLSAPATNLLNAVLATGKPLVEEGEHASIVTQAAMGSCLYDGTHFQPSKVQNGFAGLTLPTHIRGGAGPAKAANIAPLLKNANAFLDGRRAQGAPIIDLDSPERPSRTSAGTTSAAAATTAADPSDAGPSDAGPSDAKIPYGNNFVSAADLLGDRLVFLASKESDYDEEQTFEDLSNMGFNIGATRVILDRADGDQGFLFSSLLEQQPPTDALQQDALQQVRERLAKARMDAGEWQLDMASVQGHPLTEGQLQMGVGLRREHPAHRLDRNAKRLEGTTTTYPELVEPVAILRRAAKKWLRAASYLKSLSEGADESLLRSAMEKESSSKRKAEALSGQMDAIIARLEALREA